MSIRRPNRAANLTVFVSLVAAAIGCGSKGSGGSTTSVCNPGEAIACYSSINNCHGYKPCSADSSGYGACDCKLGTNSTISAGAGTSSVSTPSGGASTVTGVAGSNATGGTHANSTNSQSVTTSSGGNGTSGGLNGGGNSNHAGMSFVSAGAGGTLGGTANTLVLTGGTTGTEFHRRPKICDANGEHCKCQSVGLFGDRASSSYSLGTDGLPSPTTSFETWLSEKTTALTSRVETKPEALTAAFLAQFDVILLQDMRRWSLSPLELADFSNWVRNGGGVIALNGFMNNDDAEVSATNAILAFSGISYNGGGLDGSTPKGDCPESSKQLCPQSTGACCYCWNNAIPITKFATSHPVSKHINALGAYMGRSINPGDASVIAEYSGKTVAAAKEFGHGRLVAWCDDWITYTAQWSGGQMNPQTANQWETCYVAAADPPHWLTANYVFQTMQFWYNAIRYVAPLGECEFIVNEPPERVILQ